MGSESTTQQYRVQQPAAIVERFYLEQMQQFCQANERVQFETVYDGDTAQYQRQASCRIRGTPPPPMNGTLEQWDNDPEVRRRFYESVKGTTQRFQVNIITISPNLQEVIHFDTISSICDY
jgi:hypothetical protein